MLEAIFQALAKAISNALDYLKIHKVSQYRILVAFRIIISSAIPVLSLYVIAEFDVFNLRPDPITILFLASFAAGIFYFVGKQFHLIYARNQKILDLIQQKFIDEVPAKKYLRQRIKAMCLWLAYGTGLMIFFIFAFRKITLICLGLGVPAIIDTAIAIIIVSWEYNQLKTKVVKTLPKTIPE